ncbi:MAG: PAS domain S-box protein, partial [Deltaproteobacteria bacterium]|nr:PAS domain S-box protein [Candidatus Zymogenaceae bacterium]
MKRVLIVDDSIDMVRLLKKHITDAGYEVAGTASNGREAVSRAEEILPDVIIMDIVMPGTPDGIDAGAAIRRKLDIPVIFVTGYEKEELVNRAMDLGAAGYLNKPIKVGELKAAIQIALDRKESERQFKDFFRDLIESTNDLVYVMDGKGNIIYINNRVSEKLGYSYRDIVGKTFKDFVTPRSFESAADIFRRQVKGEDVGTFEIEFVDRDGNTRVIEIREQLRRNNGRIVEVCGIGRDITERKRAEEALRQSEEKYRNLFETSRDVVYISTAAGSFLDVNSSAEETFGYTHEELLTINLKDLYKDPEERERFKLLVAEKGFVKDHGVQMKKKDGTVVDCLITATVRRGAEGAVIGYQGIIRDITDQRRLQRQVMQAEKLSSLGGMISGVAHELNNPLTSIIGNAQLLMRKEIPPDFRNKLEVIKGESVRCTRIVAGLLSFAREHRPQRQMIDINAVLMESLKLREYDLKVNNIRVDIDMSDDIPETSADPFQFQQVFLNLINNSHDALRDKGGGTLSIRSFSKDNSI